MANRRGSKIKSWCWGNKTFEITQTFKEHLAKGGLSKEAAGIDIGTWMGTDLFVKEAGVVLWSYTEKAYGCQVITIKHKDCFREYVHLSRRLVVTGQKIKKGQRIGKSGNSGLVTGPHTHYTLLIGTNYKTAKRVDPYTDLISESNPAIGKALASELGSRLLGRKWVAPASFYNLSMEKFIQAIRRSAEYKANKDPCVKEKQEIKVLKAKLKAETKTHVWFRDTRVPEILREKEKIETELEGLDEINQCLISRNQELEGYVATIEADARLGQSVKLVWEALKNILKRVFGRLTKIKEGGDKE